LSSARVRFHGELADHLTRERRGVWFEHAFSGTPSLKDVIESLGPPHPEIGRVVMNGTKVGLDERLVPNAEVEVFPLVIAVSDRVPRFLLDGHLGALAGLMRMLGIDTEWRNEATDDWLASRSILEDRVLLTRDRGLLKRGNVQCARFVRARLPMEQAREVVGRFGLVPHARPFTRCLRCNTELRAASPEEIAGVPERVRERNAEFRACPSCHRVYWSGSHHARMIQRAERLLKGE
jgi:uncharacterized protein